MKRISRTVALCLVFAAGVAVAKEGVTNPTVKARMDTMQTIRQNVAVLGDMATGKSAYDGAAAQAAQAALAAAAGTIIERFTPAETDPVTEAKPEIWTSFDDFSARARSLADAAAALDASSLDGVRAGMGAVGGACRECHTVYRM